MQPRRWPDLLKRLALTASLLAGCSPAQAPPVLKGPGSLAYELETARQITRAQQMDGAIAFLGDSLTVGLATSQVADKTENFGIPSETVAGAKDRAKRLDWRGARQVVVAVGVNSLKSPTFQSDFKALLAAISRPVVAVAVFPTRPPEPASRADIARVNGMILAACSQAPSCRFLDMSARLGHAGTLRPEFSQPDGIHLTPAAYRVYADALRKALSEQAS